MSEKEQRSNPDQIDHHASLIAGIIQTMTRCSNAAAQDLKQALAEFADEIKREAIEL